MLILSPRVCGRRGVTRVKCECRCRGGVAELWVYGCDRCKGVSVMMVWAFWCSVGTGIVGVGVRQWCGVRVWGVREGVALVRVHGCGSGVGEVAVLMYGFGYGVDMPVHFSFMDVAKMR